MKIPQCLVCGGLQKWYPCPYCGGSGKSTFFVDSPGAENQTVDCPGCGGSGGFYECAGGKHTPEEEHAAMMRLYDETKREMDAEYFRKRGLIP